MAHIKSESMTRCIDECQSCHAVCLEAVSHCLAPIATIWRHDSAHRRHSSAHRRIRSSSDSASQLLAQLSHTSAHTSHVL